MAVELTALSPPAVLPAARKLAELGFRIVATRGTAKYLGGLGIECEVVNKVKEGRPHSVDAILNGEFGLVVNTAGNATDRVRDWQNVWDETYASGRSAGDPRFRITGWNDSITGEPIPEAEMREWLDRTVERIEWKGGREHEPEVARRTPGARPELAPLELRREGVVPPLQGLGKRK